MGKITSASPSGGNESASGSFIGIDVGGTNIKSVVLEISSRQQDAGEDRATRNPFAVVEQAECSRVGACAEEVLDQVADIALGHLANGSQFCGLGFCLPGAIDRASGVAGVMPNLPGSWHGLAVRDRVGELTGIATSVVNDARAFTLAESRLGAGRGLGTIVGVTLGTGLGGGVAIGGMLHEGASGFAGEIGHQILDIDGAACGCGNRGCAETFVNSQVLCRDSGQLSVEAAFRLAAQAEPRAQAAVEAYTQHLAVALANVHTLLCPDAFVIGGGIAAAGSQLLDPLQDRVRELITFDNPENFHIRPGELGSIAGAIGAALVAEQASATTPSPQHVR